MKPPLVVIVGAPNVGKSTLFNRLLGRRQAIVTDEPGMTRDRIYGVVSDCPQPFRIVDTGGLTRDPDAPFSKEIEGQVEIALQEAALVLFVVDARAGDTGLDRELADVVRRRNLPWILVANKCDSDHVESTAHDLHRLGLGTPYAISAEHGRGVEELVERIVATLGIPETAAPEADEEQRWLSLTIIGRPNVGKSSIFNRLAGEERAVVSDVPGTTRDAVDTLIEIGERRYRLIDTAGLRRPGRIERGPERFSTQRARTNLRGSDVAVLVLDAEAGFVAQDAHVAGYALTAFRPIVVAVNKWDLVSGREAAAKSWESELRHRLRFAKDVPVIFVSALTGQRVTKLLDLADALDEAAGRRVPTPELNRWLHSQEDADPDAPVSRRHFRLYYATQTGVRPPTFALFCNDPKRAHFSRRRQIENSLREQFGFDAAPIRLRFRGRSAPASRP
jgi:GTP-binding protein